MPWRSGGARRASCRWLAPISPPLATLHCDLVFNLYAATGREQALVAALLELTGLPYTGSAPLGHFLARNKHCAKAIWRDKGLPTPRSFEGELPSPADFPVIVKPARGGSGEVVDASSVIHDQAGLARHLARMEQRFAPLLVEQYIPGQELTVGLLGDPVRALPTLEVAFDRLAPGLPPIYGFEAKIRFAEWVEERQAALPADVDAEVQRISWEAFVALEQALR